MPAYPRVPLPATIDLIGEQRTLQVNHCPNPHCENYGVPARSERGKPGPSPDRDMAYKVHSTSKGSTPSIRCKSCGGNPPLKSNAGIAAEIQRMLAAEAIQKYEEITGCSDWDCKNHARPVALHKKQYRKRGLPASGQGHYYECKCCGRKTLVSDPIRLHGTNRSRAADIFGRIANKSPVRGTVRGSGCRGTAGYYRIVDFIVARCRSCSGAIDRALIEGRLSFPKNLVIESDAQEYTLNWVSRLDRRNVVLSSYCTADSRSGFVLGMHANFDGRVNPFEINVEAAGNGDLEVPDPFRQYAQYWLAGDELRAGRAMHQRLHKHDAVALRHQIAALYATADTRADVEDIELHLHNDQYWRTPSLGTGMQMHLPYTVYAHWVLLHRILCGAGVKHLQANMDLSSTSRAAFLCAFADEVKRGDAHGFFVRYTKYQTIDERKNILRKAQKARPEFRNSLPAEMRRNSVEVIRHMMRARIDNVFMKTRRLFSALERPVEPQADKTWSGTATRRTTPGCWRNTWRSSAPPITSCSWAKTAKRPQCAWGLRVSRCGSRTFCGRASGFRNLGGRGGRDAELQLEKMESPMHSCARPRHPEKPMPRWRLFQRSGYLLCG